MSLRELALAADPNELLRTNMAGVLQKALASFRPPAEESPLEALLATEKVRRLIAVYRIAIGEYTDRKLAVRRKYLANDCGPFRPRGKQTHLGVGIDSYGGLTMHYYTAEEQKNKLRKQLLELGVPMYILRQVHCGKR